MSISNLIAGSNSAFATKFLISFLRVNMSLGADKVIDIALVQGASIRNGVRITSPFQANYFGVSQLSFEAKAALFNEKDGAVGSKRMASNGEVMLKPFLGVFCTVYFRQK